MRFRSLLVCLAAATALVAVAVPAYAADTTAPTQPTNLVATSVGETSVTLSWDPSTDDVGVTRYVVSMWVADYIQQVSTVTTTTATVGGLRRGTTYRFAVAAYDAAGNRSVGSSWLKLTTAPGDAIPPTPPGQPVVLAVTATTVQLRWGPSSDANAVDFYRVYRVDGTTLTQVATSPGHPPSYQATVTNLTPETTYRFVVKAEDPVGNLSGASSIVEATTLPSGPTTPPTTTPPTTPSVLCSVTYKVLGNWGSGFQASVTVTNRGPAAIDGWILQWRFASGQLIGNLWGGNYTQVGPDVTVTPYTWNRVIPAGGSREVGFIGSSPSGNTSPTVFTLNGVACS